MALISSEAWVRIPLHSCIPVTRVQIPDGELFAQTAEIGPKSLTGNRPECRLCVPPELRWQSGRLLTDRSSVRSRVEAHLLLRFFFFPCPRAAGLPVTRGGMQGAHWG